MKCLTSVFATAFADMPTTSSVTGAEKAKATRTNRATAAALLATERKAPTSAAAPSKTSGHQK